MSKLTPKTKKVDKLKLVAGEKSHQDLRKCGFFEKIVS